MIESNNGGRFTIHFATINTAFINFEMEQDINLQYTLLLLIQHIEANKHHYENHLQYTLLLLIQYETISQRMRKEHLQYTLLLLIPIQTIDFKDISEDLQYTLLLLIHSKKIVRS